MGNIRIDISNAVTIGLVAFVGVFLINRALSAAGKPEWKA
jgi:hypothetical protein